MIAKRPGDRVRDAGELLRQIRETRARMTLRGRLIDGVSRLVPAKPIPRPPVWPSGFDALPAGRMVFGTGILFAIVLGLAGLSHRAAPDRTAAAEAVIAAPRSGEILVPTPVEPPEQPAAAIGTAEPPSAVERVLAEAPTDSGLSERTPPDSAPEDDVEKAPAEKIDSPAVPASTRSKDEPVEIATSKGPKQARRQPEPTAESASQPEPDDAAAPVADPPARATDDAKIAGWIQAAERALAANRLTTPADDNAYDRYRRVLDLEPGHATARSGLDRIAERYARLGRSALAADKPSLARLYLRRGIEVRRAHPALRGLRQRLEAADRRMAENRLRVYPPAADEAVTAPVRDSAFDFEKVGDPSRGQQGTGNIIKDFKNAWRTLFD
jgi:hypothetical protein